MSRNRVRISDERFIEIMRDHRQSLINERNCSRAPLPPDGGCVRTACAGEISFQKNETPGLHEPPGDLLSVYTSFPDAEADEEKSS